MARPRVDYTGRVYGRWVVLGPTGRATHWRCRCECGAERPIHITSLRAGTSRQCLRCAARTPAKVAAARKNQPNAVAASARNAAVRRKNPPDARRRILWLTDRELSLVREYLSTIRA